MRIIKSNSLIYPVLGFLAATALISVASGYFINYAPIHKRIHERLSRDVVAFTDNVKSYLDEEILSLPRLAHILQADPLFRQEFRAYLEDGAVNHEMFHRLIQKESELLGVSYIQLVDRKGRLIHSVDGDYFDVDVPLKERKVVACQDEISEVMAGKTIVAKFHAEERGRYEIHVTVPVLVDGEILGTVAVGIVVDDAFAIALTQFDAEKIALISENDQVIATSQFEKGWPPINWRKWHQIHEVGEILYDEDHGHAKALFYQKIVVANHPLGLVVYVNLEDSHAPLFESGRRLLVTAVIITLLVGIFGIITYYFLIHPMRTLYGKARVLLEVCSKNAGLIQPDPGRFKGNELMVLDNALETAAMTVYANLGFLTEQKEKFEMLAVRDALTNLGNRRMFHDLLETGIALCRRHGGRLALFYMDLDKFKPVNDTLGHDVGDLLLQEVAKRLQSGVRDSDVVFRLGGDEFAALLPECPSEILALEVGQRVLESVRQPYLIKGHECIIGVSIGISLYPLHGEDVETLLKKADAALYEVKKSGRGHCVVAKTTSPTGPVAPSPS